MRTIENILDAEKYLDEADVVLFDLDDTLYSEKEYVRSGYRKIAEHFQIPELETRMWSIFEAGGKAIDEALAEFGLSDHKDAALLLYREQEPDIALYPGIRELLQRIRKTKRVGVITDGRPEGQHAKIRALRLQVDKIIITDELGGISYRKPNETAFRMMQEYFQIPFEKMVYIGDNPKKDFVAPEKLGMQSIFFKNKEGLYSNG
jgi:putative hydrolase of the HAD superfamily